MKFCHKKVALILFIYSGNLLFQSCNNNNTKTNTQNNIKCFETQNGWGYEILIKNKPYIRQETIPAITGNKGFSSKENAEKAAQFVVYKIERNIMPPTVTVKELDSLGVLD